MSSPLTKPHYIVLDGLRGIAAIMVVIFHFLEAHSTSRFDMMLNHTYLAVDFFFLLSGFVIGYAYNDRWSKITTADFFKRRLIRLQPMLIAGTIIGALFFYTETGTLWPKIAETSVGTLILVTLIGVTLLPLPIHMDIRGWNEMHPLNGPAWSLYFEYIANILYAVIVRRFTTWLLAILVLCCGGYLVYHLFTSPNGDVIGGWALDKENISIGFARLLYPFFSGLLLFKIVKITKVRYGFIWAALLLILVLSFPRVGDANSLWMNATYESIIILLVFPLIVYIGASASIENTLVEKTCRFLGDLSYPLYITHTTAIYMYWAWTTNNKVSFQQGLPYIIGGVLICIAVAYALLKLYDEPARAWLKKKFKA